MRSLSAALLCMLALAAGCGGDEDNGGGGDDGGGSLPQAKQALIDDCHKGHEGDEKDLALCRCIADQLEKKHGYNTAQKFEDARKSVEDNDVPTEVQAAAASPDCQKTQ